MRKLSGLIILVFLTACEYNLGPSITNQNTNTNNNTNTLDIHDVFNFIPAPDPTAPVPAPNGGTETPLPLPLAAQAQAQAFANANLPLLEKSCQAIYGESAWQFMDGLVKTLAATDARWGYLIKSNTKLVSADVIAYRATSDNTGAWGVDVIINHCGTPSFGWQVIGFDAAAEWTGTRF